MRLVICGVVTLLLLMGCSDAEKHNQQKKTTKRTIITHKKMKPKTKQIEKRLKIDQRKDFRFELALVENKSGRDGHEKKVTVSIHNSFINYSWEYKGYHPNPNMERDKEARVRMNAAQLEKVIQIIEKEDINTEVNEHRSTYSSGLGIDLQVKVYSGKEMVRSQIVGLVAYFRNKNAKTNIKSVKYYGGVNYLMDYIEEVVKEQEDDYKTFVIAGEIKKIYEKKLVEKGHVIKGRMAIELTVTKIEPEYLVPDILPEKLVFIRKNEDLNHTYQVGDAVSITINAIVLKSGNHYIYEIRPLKKEPLHK